MTATAAHVTLTRKIADAYRRMEMTGPAEALEAVADTATAATPTAALAETQRLQELLGAARRRHGKTHQGNISECKDALCRLAAG